MPALRAVELGRPFHLGDLDGGARNALTLLQQALDGKVKDWPPFTRQATQFHLKNALAWANAATGQDVARQIDPEFVMHPSMPAAPADSAAGRPLPAAGLDDDAADPQEGLGQRRVTR
jgi:CO dehydrogenase maturation factor